MPVLQEAVAHWQSLRHDGRLVFVDKGMNEETEMYSALKAELPLDSDPTTHFNESLLHELKASAGQVLIAGQALSHCVNHTVRDLVERWHPLSKQHLVLLVDASSAVPGCEREGKIFLEDMVQAGLTLSTTSEAFA